MTPEWKEFIVTKVREVRERAEKHTEGWPVNVFYEGLTGSGMDLSFKVTAMELPTSARGSDRNRRVHVLDEDTEEDALSEYDELFAAQARIKVLEEALINIAASAHEDFNGGAKMDPNQIAADIAKVIVGLSAQPY